LTGCRRPPTLQARLGAACNLCFSSTDSPTLAAIRQPEVLRRVIDYLGGIELESDRVACANLPELPLHLPVLVQAYADVVDLPWVALHGSRVLGVGGTGPTRKHRAGVRGAYRLGPNTKIALELYVEDRVLEGLWARRHEVIPQIRDLGFDLVLAPNYSVWRDGCRAEHALQQKRSLLFFEELIAAGVPAIPDIGFAFFEPDGRMWADWVNAQPAITAVSIFCGGRKVHAERRALIETLEDIALFHEAVRPDVAFVIGGVHATDRVALYRQAAPGRRLCICNGMAYAMAQRRKVLDKGASTVARSARDCFLLNCAHSDRQFQAALEVAA
jgi:Domain of unknown function (DUF4417)